jgi:uncharacterized BrkB/YihY/UPF0761 family membrane protein
VFVICAE